MMNMKQLLTNIGSTEDLSKYFDFELRQQQKFAFKNLRDFLSQKDKNIFILKGYAGTGKTTLMGGLIKLLNEKETPFALLATTGRAAKILSNKTKTDTNTIHSHIYVFDELSEDLEQMSKLQENMAIDDKGQISLMFSLKTIDSETEKVYIIDEASMISDQPDSGSSFAKFGTGDLLADILNYDKNGKYIFVGDPCQLPPINQVNSPALIGTYIKEKYSKNFEEFELTDIVRQNSENGIIASSFKLRSLYTKNPLVKFANLPVKGHNNIILHNSHANLINEYLMKLKSEGFEYSTLLCQTNRHCSDLNKIIRTSIHKDSSVLNEGDLLMVTQNNYLTNLVNGDQVVVKKIGNREYRVGLSFLNIEVEELATKTRYSVLLIEDILYSVYTNLNNKQHKDLMIDYFKRMSAKGIIQKSEKFKENMLKDPYLNALKAVYGYALTCHKSQGGEWNEVFLYLDNKIHGIKKPGIYQWWYTAVTRAKNNLHLVNDWFIN